MCHSEFVEVSLGCLVLIFYLACDNLLLFAIA